MNIMQTTNIKNRPSASKNALLSLSKKYNFGDSRNVKRMLKKAGWKVLEESNTKARKNKGFQKHLVIFINPNFKIDKDNYLTLVYTNSHDGKCSTRFNLGIYRTICANGLVVGDNFFERRVRHDNVNYYNEISNIINEIKHVAPKVSETVKKMKNTRVTPQMEYDLVFNATKLRFKENKKVNIDSVLQIMRNGDKDNNLYVVMNRIQEKCIRGGIEYFNNETIRKSSKISNINEILRINQGIFSAACELA